MANLATEDLDVEGLHVSVIDDGTTLRLSWMGELTLRDPSEVLEPYLTGIAQLAAGRRAVTLDFSAMKFMSSASLPPILNCLRMLREQTTATRVYYNSSSSWQRVSYKCMLVLAKKLGGISIEYIR